MRNKILEFTKTNHFLLSQWDRSIDDQTLYKILPFVECTECEKDVVIVLPSFLKRKKIEKDNTTCLILIIKKRLLITSYWCNQPNYLFDKEKNAHFQMIYK